MKTNDFGKRVKQLREGLELGQSELARRVGVTPTAVWNWENNGIVPRSHTLQALASVLRVSPDELRTGVSAKAPNNGQAAKEAVASILEEAKQRLAAATGLSADRIRLQFHAE